MRLLRIDDGNEVAEAVIEGLESFLPHAVPYRLSGGSEETDVYSIKVDWPEAQPVTRLPKGLTREPHRNRVARRS